ncbi:MAG: alginate export family protein [Victivallales bacterium]|nr:alginate export family protein [Victivallales bacterium]
MKSYLKQFIKGVALCTVCMLVNSRADYTKEFENGIKLGVGGDFRARWETIGRNVIAPDAKRGPDMQYFRQRTRVWSSIEIPDAGVKFFIRLANRTQYYSSHSADPNNNGTATWEFPDEVILDSLNVTLAQGNWTIVLGRQDFSLGSGMWLADGAPYVQARSVFHDGATFKYKDDDLTVALFGFYDTWKDGSVFINDQNRRIRLGNILTLGAFAQKKFSDAISLEGYYMYADVEDKFWSPVRMHPADNNMSLHTAGARVFGRPEQFYSYSVELARQFGRNATDDSLSGLLFDTRLRFFAPEDVFLQPELELRYLFLSGDDKDTARSEGWIPLWAEYPILREETLAIYFNGNWSNLHMERAELVLHPTKDLKVTFAPALLQCDETNANNCTGGGRNIGLMLASYIDYKICKNVSFAFEVCYLNPGSFFGNGHDSVWSRTQLLFTF